ncbi:MAG: phosphotransferase [Bacteroidia bacterium]
MDEENIHEYKIIPGRGLISKSAIKARVDYLLQLGFELENITRYFLDQTSIQNNIESFIGTVEIPLGIVGPLLFKNNNEASFVYTAAGTLEGALVASMNRGAKAVSLSNGFIAKVIHQKMVRAPLFMFKSVSDASVFEKWIEQKFNSIKNIAEKYSNHAKLLKLSTHKVNNNVHVRFVYTTGDASGQNMTTTCTWHAMLWVVEHFLIETEIEIPHFVIEGNGSSDKKASRFMIDHGRGICVIAECFLEETVIEKVLRTSSEDIYRCFAPSVELAKNEGMLGFNINVANAIAAIFVATGQDLASIHESSIGILELEKKENGLFLKLTLPSLVIGTVGGGTSIEKQHEGLKIMDCAGEGKVNRFAQLIAGFALSLEISTYAAIVSGEFAKAHEKLGRNKPNKWLLKQEINEVFIKSCLHNKIFGEEISHVEVMDKLSIENGILTNITQRVNKKITGFLSLCVSLKNGDKKNILIKSKALDIEVIKGLHLMAASINPQLSDLFYSYRENLEYWNCHLKELNIYSYLAEKVINTIPIYYGKYVNNEREIYFLFQEFLDKKEMQLMDDENSPWLWKEENIKEVILAISKIHIIFLPEEIQNSFPEIKIFEPWMSITLYKKMISILNQETDQTIFSELLIYVDELKGLFEKLELPITIIHNDFNPRNVAIRKNGMPCIYDWELATKNIPHRDIVEFLCFSLALDFKEQEFMSYLKYHYKLMSEINPEITWEKWKAGYIYSLKEFLVTRGAFYKVSEILMKLKFGDRIMLNGIRMIKILSA